MKIKAVTIDNFPKRDNKNNYVSLTQQKFIAYVQEWSGELWTDYNPHDPGITLMDYLIYALYDLKFKLRLPIIEYLRSKNDNVTTNDFINKLGLLSTEDLNRKAYLSLSDYSEIIHKNTNLDHIYLKYDIEEKSINFDFDLSDSYLENYNEYTDNLSVKTIDEITKKLEKDITKLFNANRNIGEEISFFKRNDSDEEFTYFKFENPTDITLVNIGEKFKKQYFEIDYETIQYDLPNIFGLSKDGYPIGLSNDEMLDLERFKSFILIFDVLIVNTLDQLKALKNINHEEKNKECDLLIYKLKGNFDNFFNLSYDSNNIENNYYFELLKKFYCDILQKFRFEDVKNVKDIFIRLKLNSIRYKAANLLDSHSESTLHEVIKIVLSNDLEFFLLEARLLSKAGLFLDKIKSEIEGISDNIDTIYLFYNSDEFIISDKDIEMLNENFLPFYLKIESIPTEEKKYHSLYGLYKNFRIDCAKKLNE